MFRCLSRLFGRSTGDGPADPKSAAISKEQADRKAKSKEAAKRRAVFKRQQRMIRQEINQTWRIAIGNELPKKKKDSFPISNMTRRNVWMEDLFIFNQIKAHFPDELFHAPSQYVLKWQPLGSYFQIIIPMDEPSLQENAVLEMAKMTKAQQNKMLFLFTTLDSTLPVFAPKVHPSSLVSYRDKNQVLKKLSEYFLSGRISVDDIQSILVCSPDVWSNSLFNYLPADEQAFHLYLNDKAVAADPLKSIAKQFLDEEISLKQYEDLRFPERKQQAEVESMYYPLPYAGADCVICGGAALGVVQCQTCDNMVCKACVEEVFQGEGPLTLSTPEGVQRKRRQSFLLMHHRYCMRLGELPEVRMPTVPEPSYLREFRRTTRLEVLARFAPSLQAFDDDEFVAEYEAEEREKKRLAALRIKQLADEAERLRLLHNPPELQEVRRLLDERSKRFGKLRKEIDDLTAKVMDSSHTEQFIARNRRLRGDLLDKLVGAFRPTVQDLLTQLAPMDLQGDVLPALRRDAEDLLAELDGLVAAAASRLPSREQGTGTMSER